MTTPRAPAAVRWIARTLEEAGYETWAVGGAVRDWLSGTPSADWDLTTRATPRQVRGIFSRTVPLGIEHGTVGVLSRQGVLYEVTTFRRDVETTGRHAVVAFAERLEEDLARRDFTINAVAWHPLREEVRDPYGGREDLEARVLRTVGDPATRFAEDYLRVLRGLRFAGVFALRVEPGTWRALVSAADRLGHLSAERIREEMDKLLGAPAPPSRGLALYAASGVLRRLYPEVDAVRAEPRDPDGWFAHVLRTIDLLPAHRIELRWAALLQAVGEPMEGGAWPDASDVGSRVGGGSGPAADPGERAVLRSAALLERLRSSNARIREVAALTRWTVRPPEPELAPAELRRWLSRAGRESLRPLLRLWLAALRADEARGEGRWSRKGFGTLCGRLRAIERSGCPLEVGELPFTGRDLIRMGHRPGPEFGEVLEHLLDSVLEDPDRNDPDWLAAEAEAWMAAGRGST